MDFTPPINPHDITIDGVSHISSKDAATLTGYSADYLDQLCRAKKIRSRLLGHAWYIDKEDLLAYRKKPHQNKKKTQVLLAISRLRLALKRVDPNTDRLSSEQFEKISTLSNELYHLIFDEWAPVKQ